MRIRLWQNCYVSTWHRCVCQTHTHTHKYKYTTHIKQAHSPDDLHANEEKEKKVGIACCINVSSKFVLLNLML